MAAPKITHYTASEGQVVFKISRGDNPSADVMFTKIDPGAADSPFFGKSGIPTGTEVYTVETEDPKHSGRAAWDPSKHELSIWMEDDPSGEPSQYEGSSLDECVLAAHNDGLLKA
jgi:hypothetical protein